jgi:methyltransferase (TIGR00027 family)
MPCLRDLATFEVDHPDTQRAKQWALHRALPALPTSVRYVGSDFNQGQMEKAMAAAGYQGTAPTIFLWEGVTSYLTEAAVDTTLRWCSRAPSSVLIFTYVHRDILTNPGAFVGTDRLFASLAKAGEKLTFGLDPKTLPEFLADRGLCLERDIGAAEYRELYLKDAARTIRGHEFYRVALARIGKSAAQAD